jgi:hypothetical protein
MFHATVKLIVKLLFASERRCFTHALYNKRVKLLPCETSHKSQMALMRVLRVTNENGSEALFV